MSILELIGIIELGLIYGLVAMGTYLTFRVIDFPDLTVDGSFALGAVTAITLIYNGVNPYLSLIAASLAGAISGFVTAYLHVKWKILGLLSGILTMSALYSINLRIMGKPNIALLDSPTIFSNFPTIALLIFISLLLLIGLNLFLLTDFGLGIRAVGINNKMSSSYGIKVSNMKIITIMLSNSIVAFAGGVFGQIQGFADIAMGNGTIIVALASIIIGETLLPSRKLLICLISCIIGSILYRAAIALALNSNDLGLQASDLNIVTSVLVAITMALPILKKRGKKC